MREADLIARARMLVDAHPAARNLSDDCCVWSPGGGETCLSTDAIVEGVHFTSDDQRLDVGRKAAAAAVSDLAAMGAVPIGAVLALCAPAEQRDELLTGCANELARLGCPLLGGDTTDALTPMLTVTVWGEAPQGGRLVGRQGGQIADLLVVTGWLGGSFASGRHLRPEPRLQAGQWFAQQDAVHAMMDISDGLAADIPRLAAAAGCGAVLLPNQVPVHGDAQSIADAVRHACCDGEDFELLVAIEPSAWPTIGATWPIDDLPISVVGWLVDEPGLWHEDHRGRLAPLDWQGFTH